MTPISNSAVRLLHQPFGQEHPYEQLPHERFPRQPLAGQPFRIGVATAPPGAVSQVRVQIWLDDTPGASVEAAIQRDWRAKQEEGVGAEFLERLERVEQDVWYAEISAPSFGHTLTYQIEADGIWSERFTVRGEAWQAGGALTGADGAYTIQRDGEMNTSPNSLPALRAIEWLTDGERVRRVRLRLAAQPDEAFFGLGERFNALDQRGHALDIRCYEQYKDQGERTYMPIPFLVSSAGYGLYVDSRRWMRFDLAATSPDEWTLEADLGADETLALQCFEGEPLEVIAAYTRHTGLSPLPPLWAFGLWMSGNDWNTQARVEQEVAKSFELDIAPSVLVIEAWSDETTFYIWNDAKYAPKQGAERFHYEDFTFLPDGKWTDPKAMVDALHAREVRVLLWQVPVLKRADTPHAQHDADRAHYEAHGFGVREADGSAYQVKPFWFRGGYLWDMTNEAERAWWLAKRQYLLDEVGIDGFKTDGGEHLWGAGTRFADGRQGDELWNDYPRLYTAAYYDFANAHHRDGAGNAVTFSRAGFAGSQRSPLHWAGDENSTWAAFRHSIYAGLSAAASGITFWGWDFGGFSGDIPSAELYLRAAAMAAFCPVFQYHAEYNAQRQPSRDRTPWNIAARVEDTSVIDRFRFLVNVRRNLMPYIWQEAQHSAATGEPMMRASRWAWAQAADTQYCFGRDLLICPITEPGIEMWMGELPPGEWIHLWTRTPYQGEEKVRVDAPLERIPIFVRRGVRLPVRLGEARTLGDAVSLSSEANDHLQF